MLLDGSERELMTRSPARTSLRSPSAWVLATPASCGVTPSLPTESGGKSDSLTFSERSMTIDPNGTSGNVDASSGDSWTACAVTGHLTVLNISLSSLDGLPHFSVDLAQGGGRWGRRRCG